MIGSVFRLDLVDVVVVVLVVSIFEFPFQLSGDARKGAEQTKNADLEI